VSVSLKAGLGGGYRNIIERNTALLRKKIGQHGGSLNLTNSLFICPY
jgi:hypothetical protein